jgi:hypothetical protein
MLSSEQNPEECDATNADSSNAIGQIILPHKQTSYKGDTSTTVLNLFPQNLQRRSPYYRTAIDQPNENGEQAYGNKHYQQGQPLQCKLRFKNTNVANSQLTPNDKTIPVAAAKAPRKKYSSAVM